MASVSPADQPIRVHSTSGDFHPEFKENVKQGWNQLVEEFGKRFGKSPSHIARAPGRVNLIGEHIDYCLFGVLPAAVERDILIACAPSDDPFESAITIQNLDGTYSVGSIDPLRAQKDGEWILPIDKTKLDWQSYIKAAYHGVLSHFFSSVEGPSPKGANFLVTGSVPLGGGLSSSAALVVASTLAFLAVNDKLASITQGQLVELCMENETRVGVNSGGMDQGASVFSSSSSALYISFWPKLHASPVPLPQTAPPTVYVIANTLKTANKLETAKIHYNLRVVETLAAARVLARGLGVQVGPKEKVRLREVLARWIGEKGDEGTEEEQIARLKAGLEKIAPEVERILGAGSGQRGLTYDEMVEASGLDKATFDETYLSWVEVEASHFQLYKRAKHVFSEALRVLQFREVSLRGVQEFKETAPMPTVRQFLGRQMPQPDPDSKASDSAQHELGRLMNESHESCDQLFDCSSPELNQLTSLAREAGALGSRLTGAGWGGCCVSLVPEAQVAAFIEQISKAYPAYQDLSKEELDQVIFATKPGSGAGVYDVAGGLS
ncbi:galactokinase [Tulasnella sp. 425]|nr:galactokinase [Tulasnella sp. 425]